MVLFHAALLLLALHADAGTGSEDFQRLGEHVSVLGVTLNRDTFADVQNRLGKAQVRHNGGDGAASASGACYVGPDGTILALISVSEGGGGKLVTSFHLASEEPMVIYAPTYPEYVVPKKARPTCSRLQGLSRATATPGGLRLGLSVQEARGLLGTPKAEAAYELIFSAARDTPSLFRSVRIQVAHGVVTGILALVDPL
jgi:hypothetical protein